MRSWRALLVWLHVITSVGWMGQVLTLFALILYGSLHPEQREPAGAMAHLVDRNVLVPLANASAFTGFMLCALTPWGYFRSWWVLTKAVITVVQLSLGIFVLSPTPVPGNLPLVVGMISGLGLQAWLSVAKPWGRTPWAGRPGTGDRAAVRLPSGSRTAFGWALLVPWLDAASGLALGHPMPLLSLGTTIGYAALRGVRLRRGSARPGRDGGS